MMPVLSISIEDDMRSAASFTQKAKDFFAPKPRQHDSLEAFHHILRQVHQTIPVNALDSLDTPFLYLNGKSRRWQEYGEKLSSMGCLAEIRDLLSEYLNFLRTISPRNHKEVVSQLRQLDKCWESNKDWRALSTLSHQ